METCKRLSCKVILFLFGIIINFVFSNVALEAKSPANKNTAELKTYYNDFNNRYVLWFFPSEDTKVYGINIGIFSWDKTQKTYGLRLELIGVGLFSFLFPGTVYNVGDIKSYIEEFDERKSRESVYGVNFSLGGSVIRGELVGFSFGSIYSLYARGKGMMVSLSSRAYEFNGLQIGIFSNGATKIKGVQISTFSNFAFSLKGVQIGLFNRSREDTKGIQFGLLNINEHRTLPIINW